MSNPEKLPVEPYDNPVTRKIREMLADIKEINKDPEFFEPKREELCKTTPNKQPGSNKN